MKVFKKILLYSLGLLLVVIVSLAASVFIFKDRILQQFVREANKSLNTPVKIGKMDVTLLEDFPNLSIVCSDVVIDDSYPGESPLFTAKKVALQLNPLKVWKGDYTIRGLIIRESETNLLVSRKGESNFNILKAHAETGEAKSMELSLKNIQLYATVVHYTDKKADQEFLFDSEKILASIDVDNDIYLISANGDVQTNKLRIGKTDLMRGKSFTLQTTLRYFDAEKKIVFEPSTIGVVGSAFALNGNYSWKNKNAIDLTLEGKDTNIQTLLSLLPKEQTATIRQYTSEGDVYFKASLRGQISEGRNPATTIEFGFNNATLTHAESKTSITNATLTGSFAASDVMKLQTATMVLNNISGTLNNEPFTGKLVVQNLLDPDVIAQFKGRISTESLITFYPVEYIKQASGNILADVSFEGKISWLKARATAQKVSATGSIELEDLAFLYGNENIEVKNLQGTLQFNNNDLALSNVGGMVGRSDFLMNGFFKNAITFMLFENQPIGIETDLHANYIDLDELFSFGFGNTKADGEYIFSISPNVYLNFNCAIGHLNYKRFDARKIQGNLLVKNQVAISRNLSLNTLQGGMTLNGIVDATNPKAIDVVSSFTVTDITVDSVFYVFEDFNQDFIQAKHLKGTATADVTLEMVLNGNLKLFSETLVADIRTTIKNGELNNFEPLKALNKYLDDDGLSRLRFADLSNEIHIENKTIFIPQMDVRSNVTAFQLSGTHKFDQQIDYKVVAPLRNKKKINIEEAGSALEELDGRTKVFLKISGTTDNYKVQYDTEAVRKKIADDLKKEVKELKDAFKLKGQKKKKELEVTDEEFDWEN